MRVQLRRTQHCQMGNDLNKQKSTQNAHRVFFNYPFAPILYSFVFVFNAHLGFVYKNSMRTVAQENVHKTEFEQLNACATKAYVE